MDYLEGSGYTGKADMYREYKVSNKSLSEIADDIIEAINDSNRPISDFVDDAWEMADQINAILMDSDDDKIFRMNEVRKGYVQLFANWLASVFEEAQAYKYRKMLGL